MYSHQSTTVMAALSQRELVILQLVAKGLTSKRIAESLDITTQTVQTHRRNMLRKTHCSNTQQLVGLAVTKGWTKPETYERTENR